MVFALFVTRASLCCACIGCIIAGITCLMLATEQKYKHDVEAYTASVEVWSAKSTAFTGLTGVALIAVVATNATLEQSSDSDAGGSAGPGVRESEVALSRHQLPDPFRGKPEAGDLPAYQSTAFRANADAAAAGLAAPAPATTTAELLPETSFASLGPEEEKGMLRAGTRANFTLLVGGSEIAIAGVPLVRAVAHWEPEGVYDHCADTGGVHTYGGKCWVLQRLTGLCVQIAADETGAWRLAPRIPDQNTSYGCSFSLHGWEAAEYATVRTARGPGHREAAVADNRTVGFGNFSAEVRSAHDPYFTALSLTHGSLDFGWTEAEEDVLGIVLLIMGIAFGAPPVHAMLAAWRKSRAGAREAEAWRSRKKAGGLPFGLDSPAARAARQRAGSGRAARDPDPEMVGMRYAEDEVPRV